MNDLRREQRQFQDDWPLILTADELDAATHWLKENYAHQRRLFAFPERWD